MMPAVAVIGAQWGDEGKGKIAYVLSRSADFCVRFNGGPNAGHTVVDKFGEARLHQIPAGALHKGCVGVLAHGMVLDPWALEDELNSLSSQGWKDPTLLISGRIHLLLPYHRVREEQEGIANRIGTTRKGVGPAYADRVARKGLRLMDLRDRQYVRERLWTEAKGGFDPERLLSELFAVWERFAAQIGDAQAVLAQALRSGKTVVFEGAQGTLLDVDFGTYPFVTSSTTTVHGVSWGTGVWPEFSAVVGVAKAYTTRVGVGPFPTEEHGPLGERLRQAGREYGTTTGRPRRCGWLDLVALRYAQAINGFTHLALTKLDVLSGLPELRLAVAYLLDGKRTEDFPPEAFELERAVPVYEVLPGWQEDIRAVRDFAELPVEARNYVRFVEEVVGVPVALIGTGPEAEALIVGTEILPILQQKGGKHA